MQTQIFPAGYIINTPYLDAENIKPYAQNWDILWGAVDSKTKLLIRFEAFHTPKIQCSYAHYTSAIYIKGFAPKDCVVLSFFATDGIINFQNQKISKEDIIITTDKIYLDITANSDTEVYTLAIEKDLLTTVCKKYFGCAYSDLSIENRLKIKKDYKDNFIAFFKDLLLLYTDKFMLKFISSNYDKIEEDILHTILSMIDISTTKIDKKSIILKEIKNIMHEHIESDMKIYQIANMLKISQRNLEYIFKEQTGMTPKQYYHALRLNAIREEIIKSRNKKNIFIANIAKKYNFHHLSHFSYVYKKMFKETPQETLNHYRT